MFTTVDDAFSPKIAGNHYLIYKKKKKKERKEEEEERTNDFAVDFLYILLTRVME